MIGHEVGASGAVESHPEQLAMRERSVKSFDVLAAEQSAHRLDRSRHGDRGRDAEFCDRSLNADETGLAVERVVDGFEQQDVGAAFDQAFGLQLVAVAHLIERDAAGDRDALGRRPHRARDEARLVRGAEASGLFPRQGRGKPVDFARILLEAVLGEHDGTSLETRGLDNVGADFEKAVVHSANQIRPRAHDVLVAAFVASATVVSGGQVLAEHEGAERAVQNEDSFGEQLFEELDPLRVGDHFRQPVLMQVTKQVILAMQTTQFCGIRPSATLAKHLSA